MKSNYQNPKNDLIDFQTITLNLRQGVHVASSKLHSRKINSLAIKGISSPKKGGMADNSSLLAYRKPTPVGPHI